MILDRLHYLLVEYKEILPREVTNEIDAILKAKDISPTQMKSLLENIRKTLQPIMSYSMMPKIAGLDILSGIFGVFFSRRSIQHSPPPSAKSEPPSAEPEPPYPESVERDAEPEEQDMEDLFKVSFERYPQSTFPATVILEQTAPLEVIIKMEKSEPTQTPIKLSAMKEEKQVKVLVIAKTEPVDAFEFIGDYYKEVDVPIEDANTEPVIFMLKAKKPGGCIIKTEFIQSGTYLGEIISKTKVIDSKDKSSLSSKLISTTKCSIDTSIVAPDLSLLIIGMGSEETFKYEIILESAKANISPTRVGPLQFKGNPETKFRRTFEDIENQNAAPEVIEENLMAKGRALYDDLLSDDLKEIYWDIHNKIKSIRIISEEPWIPWEIIKPWRYLNGRYEEDGFLCEQYSFSRWLEGQPVRKKDQLKTIKLVVPKDTNLRGAMMEVDWIEQFANSANFVVSVDSTYEQVMSSLKKGGFDLLHFSTHGLYDKTHPNLSQLLLEDHLTLKPENITGLATTFGQSHPLIILNACQSGEQGFSLTGIGSWAKHFLAAEASAFIGTLWSVKDGTALRFTQMLYQKLSQGMTLDEAVREARNLARKEGDPSWLAYTLYTQPNSSMKLGS